MGVIMPVSTTGTITHMGFSGLSLSAGAGLGYVLRRQQPWGGHLEPQGRARRIDYIKAHLVEHHAAEAATA